MTDNAYPLPTASTVRRLYGSSFRCAHPECSKPLYKLLDDTGDRVLNSRVAHIHARRKEGPRWLDMPPEENRGFENLVLMCVEHSYEIDEAPEQFPADLLREWKAAQIAEYDRLQRNWPISDDDATEVLVASEAFDLLHAPSAVDLVRRVEALRLIAERTRGTTRSWARSWRQLREQTRSSFLGWDDDGNPVYMEPSEMQTRPMREGIRSALAVAVGELEPAAAAARVELAAVRATRTQVTPWCDALEQIIAGLIDVASTWTGGSDPDADAVFDTLLAELNRSIADLVRASRGEDVEVPQPQRAVDEPGDVDPFVEHRRLLDEARPFHRVDHRPYDPALRERVAEATRRAAAIPPIPHLLAIGLDTTVGLAIAVAGNSEEDARVDLVDRDRQRLPLCAATLLLQETMRRGAETDASVLAANEGLRRLWSETDWASATAWVGNAVYGQAMMQAFARVTSDEEVRDHLAHVLEVNPELLETLVISCAGWVEHLDRQTWEVTGFDRHYRELPPWLPNKIITAQAVDVLSDNGRRTDREVLDALLRRALVDGVSSRLA